MLTAGSSLNVVFGETGTSSLTLLGSAFNSSGLGIASTAANTFDTNTGIDASLAQLDAADNMLAVGSVTFASQLTIVQTREEFTKAMIATLQAGADDLTLADMDEENAVLLALQTRYKLAGEALAIASQQSSLVLRLFGF